MWYNLGMGMKEIVCAEQDLKQSLRLGNKVALAEVYNSNRGAFISFALGFDINAEEALDIYQDSIISMYENFYTKQVNVETATVKTYLFAIGRNKILQFLRNKKREIPQITLQDSEVVVEPEVDNTEYQQLLAEKLKGLSESCRRILRMYYYRNLSINEIVDQTDYKDSATVRSHKSRCMKRLKSFFNR